MALCAILSFFHLSSMARFIKISLIVAFLLLVIFWPLGLIEWGPFRVLPSIMSAPFVLVAHTFLGVSVWVGKNIKPKNAWHKAFWVFILVPIITVFVLLFNMVASLLAFLLRTPNALGSVWASTSTRRAVPVDRDSTGEWSLFGRVFFYADQPRQGPVTGESRPESPLNDATTFEPGYNPFPEFPDAAWVVAEKFTADEFSEHTKLGYELMKHKDLGKVLVKKAAYVAPPTA